MSGGGMGGVSSTGYGQPNGPSPFSEIINDTTMSDAFPTVNSNNGQVAPTSTADLNGMRNLLNGMSQSTGQSSFPQTVQQQPESISGFYRNILGRDPDEGGLNYWNQRASSGTSMDQIKQEFLNSAEFKGSPTAQQNYQNYLNSLNNPVQPQVTQPTIPDMSTMAYQQPASRGIDPYQIQRIEQPVVQQAPQPTVQQAAPQPVQPQGPVFNTPIITESGGAGTGGAMNFQYNRGGIASLVRR